MFHETELIDTKTETIDNKNRISLPEFTKAEENETLVLYKEDNFFSIYSKKDYLKKFIIQYSDYLKQKQYYDELARKTLGTTTVKSQRRINIPQEVVEYYKLEKELIVEGAIDHVNIYKKTKELKR